MLLELSFGLLRQQLLKGFEMLNDYFLLKEITVKKRTKMKEFKESIIDQKLPLGDVKNLSMKEIENILRNEDVL